MSSASLLAVINQPYLVISEPICELTPHQSTPRQQSGSYLGIEPALNYSRQMTGEQWAAGIACTVHIAWYFNDLTTVLGEVYPEEFKISLQTALGSWRLSVLQANWRSFGRRIHVWQALLRRGEGEWQRDRQRNRSTCLCMVRSARDLRCLLLLLTEAAYSCLPPVWSKPVMKWNR